MDLPDPPASWFPVSTRHGGSVRPARPAGRAGGVPGGRRRARAPRLGLAGVLVGMLLVPVGAGGPASATGAGHRAAEDRPVVVDRFLPRPPAAFVPEWSWPLTPDPTVLRSFEKPPRKWERGHRGVDLAARRGASTTVASPADGVVSFAGTVVDRGVLSIDHGQGRISSFEPVTTDLVEGRRVTRGEVVATLEPPGADGSPPGHCGVSCLHWGVRQDGEYVDPLAFVTDRRPSVLLPLDG
ncbi:M23 family metallopeptidase [Arthrobacter sp. MDT2-16]